MACRGTINRSVRSMRRNVFALVEREGGVEGYRDEEPFEGLLHSDSYVRRLAKQAIDRLTRVLAIVFCGL